MSRLVPIWSKLLKGTELMQSESRCGMTASEYQPRSTDSMAAWISSRTLNFCVMSRP